MQALAPKASFGPYRLKRLLARGGMGRVFLATADVPELRDREVVIKVLQPELAQEGELRAMFLHEARLGTSLSHANIARILDFGELGGTLYLAMEYVDGPPVSRIMRVMGEIPLAQALTIVACVAEALGYAHDANDDAGEPLQIVHRDVTPQNILVSRDGVVKLIDFGVAKSAGQDHHTRTGVLKGKLSYMAPEQFHGQVDRRTDIFALGVILHELVSGRRLFKRPTEAQVFNAILNEPIPAPTASPKIHGALAPVLARALARDVSERYDDAASFAADLRSAMQELDLETTPEDLAHLSRYTMDATRGVSRREEGSLPTPSGLRARNEQEGSDSGADRLSVPSESGSSSVGGAGRPPFAFAPRLPVPEHDGSDAAVEGDIFPEAPTHLFTADETAAAELRTALLSGASEADKTLPPSTSLPATEVPIHGSATEIRLRPFLLGTLVLLLVGGAAGGAATWFARKSASAGGDATGGVEDPIAASPAPQLGLGRGAAPATPGESETSSPGHEDEALPALGAGERVALDVGARESGTIERDTDEREPDENEETTSRAGSTDRTAASSEPRTNSDSRTASESSEAYGSSTAHSPSAASTRRRSNRPASRSRSNETSPSTASTGKGRLFINTVPWSTVYVDGRAVGSTPIVALELPAGTHSVELRDPKGESHRIRLRVKTGEDTKRFLQLDAL